MGRYSSHFIPFNKRNEQTTSRTDIKPNFREYRHTFIKLSTGDCIWNSSNDITVINFTAEAGKHKKNVCT